MGVQVALMTAGLLALSGIAIALARRVRSQHARIAQLERDASTDPLTHLLNRRGFQQRMEIELARAHRQGSPLVLVVADVDDLKQINDRLGHFGGDMALERLAAVVKGAIRTEDAAARLGGDEFAFILADTTEFQALSLTERLRTEIEKSFDGTPVALTFSLGIAGYPEHGRTGEELFHAADRAMYRAKALGKNRTALYGDELGMRREQLLTAR